ncbi:MAG TPA: hypothetical protein VF363_12285, partial [Candidatus Eisenbacteria bacterium]
FDGSAYPLPQQIRLGASRGFWRDRVLLAADYNIPRDYYKDVRVGTEIQAHPNISLRFGYRRELGSAGDPATGLSYGLGLHFHQLQLDYAMTPSNAFDDVHRLSFGYSFGGGPEEQKPETPKPEKKPLPPPPAAPTGPPVIASSGKSAPPKKVEPATTVAQAPAAKTAAAVTPPAVQAPTPAPAPAAPKMAVAPVSQYDVVLPGYSSRETADAEIKALELLGFSTKDAKITQDSSGAYMVRLASMKSKARADEMAASLARMSFRAVVEVAQR